MALTVTVDFDGYRSLVYRTLELFTPLVDITGYHDHTAKFAVCVVRTA